MTPTVKTSMHMMIIIPNADILERKIRIKTRIAPLLIFFIRGLPLFTVSLSNPHLASITSANCNVN
jgi:hypothetical protein